MTKKILLFSKESRGGIQTFLNNLSKLNDNDFEMKLFLYKKDKLFSNKTNIPTTYLGNKYPSTAEFSFKKVRNYLGHIFRSFFLIIKEKPNIVCCNDTYSMLIILPLKLFWNNLPIISIIHSDLPRTIVEKTGWIYKNLLYNLYANLIQQSSVIVFVSKGTRSNYLKKFKIDIHKTRIIYDGISLPSEKPKKIIRALVFQKDPLKIYSIGRFERQKDFGTILKSIAIVSKKYPIKLYLVGSGTLKKHLIALAMKLSIKNKVHFLDWKPNIYQYLNKADLFVFASNYETFGLTIVEALACGVPVIATDTKHGPSEVLGNGKYGNLVPVKNYRKMAMAIERLILDKKLRQRFSKFGYKRAEQFSASIMQDKYGKLFNTL